MGEILDNKKSFYRPNELLIKSTRDIAAKTNDPAYRDRLLDATDRYEQLGARRKKLKKPK